MLLLLLFVSGTLLRATGCELTGLLVKGAVDLVGGVPAELARICLSAADVVDCLTGRDSFFAGLSSAIDSTESSIRDSGLFRFEDGSDAALASDLRNECGQ